MAQPYKWFEVGDIDRIIVKKADGSTWAAEYDTAGRLTPVREIEPPKKPGSYQEHTPEGGTGKGRIESTGEEYLGGGRTITYKMPTPSPAEKKKSELLAKAMATIEQFAPGKSLGNNEAAASDERVPKMDDNVFRARLSSIMTDNKYDRRVRNRTRGKLDMTRLFKVPTKAQSVFTQKLERKNKRYNVVLVVDESGSMHGDKIVKAADIAVFLAKHFTGLNLDLEIVGFNHYIYTHKNFGSKVKDYAKLKNDIIDRVHIGGGCNHDYDALAYAYKSLAGRNGQNFVIFISDGAPVTCNLIDEIKDDDKRMEQIRDQYGEFLQYKKGGETYSLWFDPHTHLPAHEKDKRKHLNHLVEANKNLATTVGIGIRTECWQVPDNFIANSLDEMKPLILSAIKKKVRRG